METDKIMKPKKLPILIPFKADNDIENCSVKLNNLKLFSLF